MMRANKRVSLAIWAGLYAVLSVGCTSDESAGTEQGGSGGIQDDETSLGSAGYDSPGSGGVAQASGGTEEASGGAGGTVLQAGSGGAAGDEQGGSGVIITTPVVGKSLSALKRVDSCDDVLKQIKDRIREQTQETIEANLQQVLDNMEYGMNCGRFYVDAAENTASGGTSGGAPPPSGDSGASEYSTTNVQVVGVDEADFVKNDANYIYVVADGRLQIIDAWPAAQAHTIASWARL